MSDPQRQILGTPAPVTANNTSIPQSLPGTTTTTTTTMKKVAHLVRDLATKTRGKVLVVGSYTAEQRQRSSYHAILQAAQSSGIPCVPFSPLIREEEEDFPFRMRSCVMTLSHFFE